MIKGAKAGQQSQRQPVIAKDSAASISYLKILYGLSEGEISGLADGAKSIYLDDTPLLDDSGNPNFKDDNGNLAVTWDFRSGTNDQEYIKGFPSVENETNINVELKGGTPYIKTVTNSQLSAVRLRLSWAALRKQETNGDVNGITIEYAIDLSTNGGAYQQVLLTKVSDKTSAKYERSHRIDLPRGNTWNIRVRRITPNATSDLISDKMYVDAITEIIDAKLRYPNTAMLGLQYNAATFSNIAKLAVRCKGKIISVPSNYDPVARTYNGIWNGTFKQAYSNNPAWVYYDICTQWRYGLGNRLTAAMIDKWSLYALAQYCDEKVSDGRGGQEPRFTVNVYLQAQQDAFTVLQSLAAIFRAMSYWQGEQIVLDADLPKDPVYTFSRANVVDGEFSYTGTRARDRHTIAKVAWDNPSQKFKTEYEFVRDEAAIAKYGVKVLDLSIVGCTSQGQAQRAGLWALKSEQLETRTVTFKTGLDGFIPTVGSIINVSDEVLAGRANGGRVSAVSADLLTITVDRDVVVSVGDTLIVNADNGKAQRRIVSSVNGRNVTVSVAFSAVSSQNVWAVDSSDLKTMRFRVLSIKQDDVTFTITALQHEPQKYDAIDYGAIVEPTAISIIKPNVIDAPKNIVIAQRNRVEQGQNITTMIVSWEQVSGAVAYDVEWRKDDGNWIKAPRTGNNSIEINGVYSGNYLARVAAVSAFDLVSNFATSMLTAVTGKIGAPPSLANLKATGILFGMRLDWLFAQGSSDTNYTEIQVASAPDTNVALLGTYAYPTNTATINGLQGNLTQYYRGRIVDKLGNASPWTAWVSGTTSADASKVLDLLNGQITESQLYKDLGDKIGKIGTIETGLSNEIKNRVDAVKINADAIAAERDARIADIKTNSDAVVKETQDRIAAVKSVSDGLTQEIIDRKSGDTSTLEVITTYKTSNDKAMAAVQSDVKTVTTAQSATATKLDGVYAIVTPLTADSNNWKADSGSKQATAWTLQSAIATGDYTLSSRIDVLTAGFNSNSAAITSEQTARADADKAITQRVDSYIAQTDSSIATIKQDVKTATTATTANSNAITALDNRVTTIDTNTNTAMQNAASAVSKADTAVTQAGSASSLAQTASATATNAQSVADAARSTADTAKSTADTAKSTADTANTNAATAISKANAAADSASATASTLQQVQADLSGKASTGSVTAVDGKVTELDGKITANTTKLDGIYARVVPLTADSNSWKADSGSKSATGWTLQSAIVDGDSALSSRIDVLTASVNSNAASITSEQTARVNADSALSSRIDTLNSDYQGNKATVSSQLSTLSTSSSSQASSISGLQASVSTAQSTANTAVGKADNAQLTANTANAAVQSEQTARANADSALSSRIDTVQSTVGNNTASIQTQQKSIDGLNAQYTVKVDVNGRVSGFGLASSNTQSDFAIRADKFYIAPPDGTGNGVSPFMVLTSSQTINGTVVPAGTYIKSAYIHNGSIDVAKIADATITSAKIGQGEIKSVNIGTAQVDTLQLAGQSVSVTSAINQTTFFNAKTSAFTDAVYLITGGTAVSVEFSLISCNPEGSGSFTVECFVNDVSQNGWTMAGAFGYYPSMFFPFLVSSAATGSTKIQIKVTSNGAQIGSAGYFLKASSLKR